MTLPGSYELSGQRVAIERSTHGKKSAVLLGLDILQLEQFVVKKFDSLVEAVPRPAALCSLTVELTIFPRKQSLMRASNTAGSAVALFIIN